MNLSFAEILMNITPHFGWAGSLVILTGAFIASLGYTGRTGEGYSLLNHFISELGEVGVSRLARVFNIAMMLGGTLFLPLILGLGITLSSWSGWLGTAAGVVAAVSAVFVGIFSMERLEPHRVAAMTFFRTGLVTILFFTLAVFLQPAENRLIPLSVNIIGVFAILCYSVFLLTVREKTDKNGQENYLLDPTEKKSRPRFWRTPFYEWMLFFATIAWFLSVSLILIF